jgi:N-acetylmuramoyl-L-alanine amidase
MRPIISLILILTVSFVAALLHSSCSGERTPVAAQTESNQTNSLPLATTQVPDTPKPENENFPSAAVTEPKILTRKEWKAKDPVGKGKEHTIRYITIHHTGEVQRLGLSLEKKMQGLQNFSQAESRLASGKMKPVWFDVPYHYYIAADGSIAEGREIKYVGDTNTEYDPTGHALVVVEGNFQTEKPTPAQIESLELLVAWLAATYKVPLANIKAHNDYASTECPGRNLKELFASGAHES